MGVYLPIGGSYGTDSFRCWTKFSSSWAIPEATRELSLPAVMLAHLVMSLLSQLLIWKWLWNSLDILLLKMILSVELVPPVHENWSTACFTALPHSLLLSSCLTSGLMCTLCFLYNMRISIQRFQGLLSRSPKWLGFPSSTQVALHWCCLDLEQSWPRVSS